MPKTEYAKKLLDPRWQKKRLEILERDNWKCMACGEKDRTLHVHHIFYLPRKEPWDIPNGLLITFCEDCHKNSPCNPEYKTCAECPDYNDPDDNQKCHGRTNYPVDIISETGRFLNFIWANAEVFGELDYSSIFYKITKLIEREK